MTDEIKADEAARLKAKLRNVSNVSAWADAAEIPGGKSMVSQHIHGKRPISLDCAVAYAIALDCPLSDISPRLAAAIERLPRQKLAQVLMEQPANYGPKIKPMPERKSTLEQELTRVAATISDEGLHRLIERACWLAEHFPKKKPTKGN